MLSNKSGILHVIFTRKLNDTILYKKHWNCNKIPMSEIEYTLKVTQWQFELYPTKSFFSLFSFDFYLIN